MQSDPEPEPIIHRSVNLRTGDVLEIVFRCGAIVTITPKPRHGRPAAVVELPAGAKVKRRQRSKA